MLTETRILYSYMKKLQFEIYVGYNLKHECKYDKYRLSVE